MRRGCVWEQLLRQRLVSVVKSLKGMKRAQSFALASVLSASVLPGTNQQLNSIFSCYRYPVTIGEASRTNNTREILPQRFAYRRGRGAREWKWFASGFKMAQWHSRSRTPRLQGAGAEPTHAAPTLAATEAAAKPLGGQGRREWAKARCTAWTTFRAHTAQLLTSQVWFGHLHIWQIQYWISSQASKVTCLPTSATLHRYGFMSLYLCVVGRRVLCLH